MAEFADLSTTDASNVARFPEGQAPSTVNNGARALEGLIARGLKDSLETNLTSTGSSNAYVVAANRTLSAYYAGLRISFIANFTNTAASTVNVDAIGAKNIFKHTNAGPAALVGQEIQSGDVVDLIYDGTQFQLLSASSIGQAAGLVTFTFDMTGASATQAVTGLGFKPRFVIFYGVINSTASWGFGSAVAVSTGFSIYNNTTAMAANGSAAFTLATSGSANQTITVNTFDSDGFTANKVKTGSPTGTASVYALCFR